MKRRLRVCLVGAGNVMTTRHMTAFTKNRRLFELVGILDDKPEKSKTFAKRFNIPNHGGLNYEENIKNCSWVKSVHVVVIAVPPNQHYSLVKMFLQLNKHVMVEKPFTTDVQQARELIRLAKRKKLILAVKHNFQFTNSFRKLWKMLDRKDFGVVRGLYCVQLTNHKRRIPAWSESLPMGLFFDESPHFFYLIRKLCGDNIRIKSVFKERSNFTPATPRVINLNLEAGGIPVTVYWNFDSPVCEWYFIVFGEKKLIIVDLFRDIIIVLPNDAPHLTFQVLRTSILTTWFHWFGVITNGFMYLQQRLYYGFDIAQINFYKAVVTKKKEYISGMADIDGLFVTNIQTRICNRLKTE